MEYIGIWPGKIRARKFRMILETGQGKCGILKKTEAASADICEEELMRKGLTL